MAEFLFTIDLPIRNEWENVDLLRSSVQNCFTAVFRDLDGCHAIAMITGELLENAIKYGDWSGSSNVFHLKVVGQAHHARVVVENPVREGDPGVQDLIDTLEWMKGFGTAEQAYRARLLQIAAEPSRESGLSKLGLVRIAYEGNCVLRSETPMPGLLRVTAEVPF
jgi:hypothetical protein